MDMLIWALLICGLCLFLSQMPGMVRDAKYMYRMIRREARRMWREEERKRGIAV